MMISFGCGCWWWRWIPHDYNTQIARLAFSCHGRLQNVLIKLLGVMLASFARLAVLGVDRPNVRFSLMSCILLFVQTITEHIHLA